MCSAVRRRMLSNGIVSSRVAGAVAVVAVVAVVGTGAGPGRGAGSGSGTGYGDGAGSGSGTGVGSGSGTGCGVSSGAGVGVGSGANTSAGSACASAAGAGAGVRVACAASRTSLRVIRPPGPLPWIVLTSRPRSATRRRTIGEVSEASAPACSGSGAGTAAGAEGAAVGGAGGAYDTGATGSADAAGALAGTAGGAGGSGSGAGSGSEAASRAAAGSTAASGTGAGGATSAAGTSGNAASGSGAAPAASPTTASRVPTSTVSPSGTRICEPPPPTGAGTSESTLSVETSNNGSSASTCSPTFFNQRVIVPSVTVSPSWGIVTSTAYSSGGGGIGGAGSAGRSMQRATGEREGGLAEHLAERRVGMDQRGDVGRVGLPVHAEVPLAEQLGGPWSGEVHAEQRAVGVGHQLHEPVGVAEDHRPRVPGEPARRDHDVVAALTGLLLGEPAPRHLGLAVHDPRNLLVVDRRGRLAQDGLHDHDRLGEADVRQLGRVDHVAGGEDARDVGAHLLVDHDVAPFVDLHLGALEPEAGAQWCAPDAHDDLVDDHRLLAEVGLPRDG